MRLVLFIYFMQTTRDVYESKWVPGGVEHEIFAIHNRKMATKFKGDILFELLIKFERHFTT